MSRRMRRMSCFTILKSTSGAEVGGAVGVKTMGIGVGMGAGVGVSVGRGVSVG